MWRKARSLAQTLNQRIEVGQKMLNAADNCHLTLPDKAAIIAEISGYLQQIYREAGDKDNMRRMKRITEVASRLLQGRFGQN